MQKRYSPLQTMETQTFRHDEKWNKITRLFFVCGCKYWEFVSLDTGIINNECYIFAEYHGACARLYKRCISVHWNLSFCHSTQTSICLSISSVLAFAWCILGSSHGFMEDFLLMSMMLLSKLCLLWQLLSNVWP